MAAKRLVMKDIGELFRLRFEVGLSQRKVAKILGCTHSTVHEYEKRAKAGGLGEFSEIKDLSREELLNILGLKAECFHLPRKAKYLPDWSVIHRELSRKHVTLRLLWTEYKQEHPEGYQYTQFCELYKRWSGKLSVSMRPERRCLWTMRALPLRLLILGVGRFSKPSYLWVFWGRVPICMLKPVGVSL